MGVLIERHEKKKALCDVEFTKENHLPEIHEIVKMETPFLTGGLAFVMFLKAEFGITVLPLLNVKADKIVAVEQS